MRHLISTLAVGIVALSVLSACNSTEKTTRALSSTPTPATVPVADGVRRVTVSELKDLLANNDALVIDVRNQMSYDQGHIRGSILIPEAEVVNHIDELPKNKLIVTYCS